MPRHRHYPVTCRLCKDLLEMVNDSRQKSTAEAEATHATESEGVGESKMPAEVLPQLIFHGLVRRPLRGEELVRSQGVDGTLPVPHPSFVLSCFYRPPANTVSELVTASGGGWIRIMRERAHRLVKVNPRHNPRSARFSTHIDRLCSTCTELAKAVYAGKHSINPNTYARPHIFRSINDLCTLL